MLISFDLWGTLIKANPIFFEKKVELTKEYFPSLSGESIKDAYKRTKLQLDSIIEKTGWQPEIGLIFSLLFAELGSTIHTDYDTQEEFSIRYQSLAIDYPPLIYSDETIEVLTRMEEHYKLCIASNTLLIEGSTMIMCLNQIGIRDLFKHKLFSSTLLVSKPHPNMFGLKPDYHIGDNPITDGNVPKGTEAIIINSNKKTIKDAYDIITQNR